jgi:hypothetical protein
VHDLVFVEDAGVTCRSFKDVRTPTLVVSDLRGSTAKGDVLVRAPQPIRMSVYEDYRAGRLLIDTPATPERATAP